MSLFDPPLPRDEDRPTIEEIEAGEERLAEWRRKEIPEDGRTHGGNHASSEAATLRD